MEQNKLTIWVIKASSDTNNELFHLIDQTLKGKEIRMPSGQSFIDKDGQQRNEIRIKCWLDPSTTKYKDMSVIPMDDKLPHTIVNMADKMYYSEADKPVFFGHYWLTGEPFIYCENTCCLDFSVAKGGFLTAYRYEAERSLSNSK